MFVLIDGIVISGSIISRVPIEHEFPVVETTDASFPLSTTQISVLGEGKGGEGEGGKAGYQSSNTETKIKS